VTRWSRRVKLRCIQTKSWGTSMVRPWLSHDHLGVSLLEGTLRHICGGIVWNSLTDGNAPIKLLLASLVTSLSTVD
jgi:hypothetical protein